MNSLDLFFGEEIQYTSCHEYQFLNPFSVTIIFEIFEDPSPRRWHRQMTLGRNPLFNPHFQPHYGGKWDNNIHRKAFIEALIYEKALNVKLTKQFDCLEEKR